MGIWIEIYLYGSSNPEQFENNFFHGKVQSFLGNKLNNFDEYI